MENNGLSRRNVLKGLAAVAAAAVAGVGGLEEAEAREKQKYPPGYSKMLDAAKEMYGLDAKKAERDAAFKLMEKVDRDITEKAVRPAAAESDYRQALDPYPGFNWASEQGERLNSYIQEWMHKRR